MDFRSCPRCKNIYKYDGFKICHSCRKNDETDFEKVKEYLVEYPGANISTVVRETEVDSKKVIEFLREGRLEIEAGGDIILECEKCGVSVTTGRYCNKCAGGLQREFGQAADSTRASRNKSETTDLGKFRVIDRYEKRR